MIKNSVNRSKQSLLAKVPFVKWGKMAVAQQQFDVGGGKV